ncbi:unnamed protein product [Pleuronectes platessa]|uniref:Uncharacterized protein n=1 Tax=Pleuronectes platessa TaxID=8262 RepID=A0A9N7Z8T3_PLEPL|nr:unnamed protein product [Pleuronectes platessa]
MSVSIVTVTTSEVIKCDQLKQAVRGGPHFSEVRNAAALGVKSTVTESVHFLNTPLPFGPEAGGKNIFSPLALLSLCPTFFSQHVLHPRAFDLERMTEHFKINRADLLEVVGNFPFAPHRPDLYTGRRGQKAQERGVRSACQRPAAQRREQREREVWRGGGDEQGYGVVVTAITTIAMVTWRYGGSAEDRPRALTFARERANSGKSQGVRDSPDRLAL